MPRSEDPMLATIDDTSAAWVGVRLEVDAVRRLLRLLLSRYALQFDAEALDALTEAGLRLSTIDALTRSAQRETTTLRTAYRAWRTARRPD